MTNRYVELLS